MTAALSGTTLLVATHCPYCGHTFDAVGTPDESPSTPSPGDTTVCTGCARVLYFQPDMSLRKPRPGELETMLIRNPAHTADLARLQSIIRSIPHQVRPTSARIIRPRGCKASR